MPEDLGALHWSITVGDEEARAKLDSFYEYAKEIADKIASLKPQFNMGGTGPTQYGGQTGSSERPVGPAPTTPPTEPAERFAGTPTTIRDAVDRGIGEAIQKTQAEPARVVGAAEVKELPTGYTEVSATPPIQVATRPTGPPPTPQATPPISEAPADTGYTPEVQRFTEQTMREKFGVPPESYAGREEEAVSFAKEADPKGYDRAIADSTQKRAAIATKQVSVDAEALSMSQEDLETAAQKAKLEQQNFEIARRFKPTAEKLAETQARAQGLISGTAEEPPDVLSAAEPAQRPEAFKRLIEEERLSKATQKEADVAERVAQKQSVTEDRFDTRYENRLAQDAARQLKEQELTPDDLTQQGGLRSVRRGDLYRQDAGRQLETEAAVQRFDPRRDKKLEEQANLVAQAYNEQAATIQDGIKAKETENKAIVKSAQQTYDLTKQDLKLLEARDRRLAAETKATATAEGQEFEEGIADLPKRQQRQARIERLAAISGPPDYPGGPPGLPPGPDDPFFDESRRLQRQIGPQIPAYRQKTGLVGSFLGFGAIREGIRAVTEISEYETELAVAGNDQQAILEADLRRRDQLTRGGLVGRAAGFVQDPSGLRRAEIDVIEQRSQIEDSRSQIVSQVRGYTSSLTASSRAALAGPGREARAINLAEIERNLDEHRDQVLKPLIASDAEDIKKYEAQFRLEIANRTGEGFKKLYEESQRPDTAAALARGEISSEDVENRVATTAVAAYKTQISAQRDPTVKALEASKQRILAAQKRQDAIDDALEQLSDASTLRSSSARAVGLDFQADYEQKLFDIDAAVIAAPPERKKAAEAIAQQQRQALAFQTRRTRDYAIEDYTFDIQGTQSRERGDATGEQLNKIEIERRQAQRQVPRARVGPFGAFDPFIEERNKINQDANERRIEAAQQGFRRDRAFDISAEANIGVSGLRGSRRFQEAELAQIYGETQAAAAAEPNSHKKAEIELAGEARVGEALKRFAHDFEHDVILAQGNIDATSELLSRQPLLAQVTQIRARETADVFDLPQTRDPAVRAQREQQIRQQADLSVQLAEQEQGFTVGQIGLQQQTRHEQLAESFNFNPIGAQAIGIRGAAEERAKQFEHDFGPDIKNPLAGSIFAGVIPPAALRGAGTGLAQGEISNAILEEQTLRRQYLFSRASQEQFGADPNLFAFTDTASYGKGDKGDTALDKINENINTLITDLKTYLGADQ